MKVVSISMVKNESDIIESFVRYNLNIVDEMIILDNGSSDETLEILNHLKNEGLPIRIIIDDDKYYEQDKKMNRLLNRAVYEFDADVVCPLDADEFISSDNENPKDIINTFEPYSYCLVKWRTYLPKIDENNSKKFIPSKYTYIYDENIKRYNKVILTKELVKDFNAKLSMGNHYLIFNEIYKDEINIKRLDALRISHFPFRSKEQIMSKVLVGWPNMLAKETVNRNHGNHWETIFNKILNNQDISDNDILEFSKVYCYDSKENEKVYHLPMNISFIKDIEIKYEYNYNFLRNLLENYIYFSSEIHELKKEIAEKEKIIEQMKSN